MALFIEAGIIAVVTSFAYQAMDGTADCKSLTTSKLNSGKPQLCLNREVGHAEVGHAEAGKIIIFICGKSIVVFHCSASLLQDFCNLL